MLDQPLPEFLYHYTGSDAFLKITETGRMWATNIMFLNDASEFKHGAKLADEEAAALLAAEVAIPRDVRVSNAFASGWPTTLG
jgi:hypothetical protein